MFPSALYAQVTQASAHETMVTAHSRSVRDGHRKSWTLGPPNKDIYQTHCPHSGDRRAAPSWKCSRGLAPRGGLAYPGAKARCPAARHADVLKSGKEHKNHTHTHTYTASDGASRGGRRDSATAHVKVLWDGGAGSQNCRVVSSQTISRKMVCEIWIFIALAPPCTHASMHAPADCTVQYHYHLCHISGALSSCTSANPFSISACVHACSIRRTRARQFLNFLVTIQ